jgi:hypothetical protein
MSAQLPNEGEPIPAFLKLDAPLKQHQLVAELGLPMMPEDELGKLGEDIKANGLHDPITIYEDKILDGWNRYNAGRKAEYEFTDDDYVQFSDADPLAFVISKNILRRHLTRDDKKKLIAIYTKLYPDRSSRWIASDLGVSHHTVESVRTATGPATEPEATEPSGGQIAQPPDPPETRKGADNKNYGKRNKSSKAVDPKKLPATTRNENGPTKRDERILELYRRGDPWKCFEWAAQAGELLQQVKTVQGDKFPEWVTKTKTFDWPTLTPLSISEEEANICMRIYQLLPCDKRKEDPEAQKQFLHNCAALLRQRLDAEIVDELVNQINEERSQTDEG